MIKFRCFLLLCCLCLLFLGTVCGQDRPQARVQVRIRGDMGAIHYVLFYPLQIGTVQRAEVQQIKLPGSSDGRVETLLPAGRYVIQAFSDRNGNNFWDGAWFGQEAERRSAPREVLLRSGDNPEISLSVGMEAEGLPQPIWEANPAWAELSERAWAMAKANISRGQTQNGFVHAYMDEGVNEYIYQWDNCFMMFFGVYGGTELPAMNSVDNFYQKQREDGYICRVYHQATEQGEAPTADEPQIHPPLFAWAEWHYYRVTGDKSRLLRALAHNHAYYRWLQANARRPEGYYFTSTVGSGMDNSPREGEVYGWVDMTAQMAFFARCMDTLATASGHGELATYYAKQHAELSTLLNERMWDPKAKLYLDVRHDGRLHPRKTIAAFWPLIAGCVPKKRQKALIKHLTNPKTFGTPYPIPTLSRDDPDYAPQGHYWRGAVWTPTTMMVIKGLEYSGYDRLAHRLARRHIEQMYNTYSSFVPDSAKLAIGHPNVPANGNGRHEIWECYSAEKAEPATRWDNQYYVRQQFVGGSGNGPLTLLIENVIGLRIDAPRQTITWDLHQHSPQGIRNLSFLGHSLSMQILGFKRGKPVIQVDTSVAFTLIIRMGNKKIIRHIPAKRI